MKREGERGREREGDRDGVGEGGAQSCSVLIIVVLFPLSQSAQ